MASLGKLIVLIGGAIVVFGLVVWLVSHVTGGNGKPLPGDIVIRRHNTTIYFPIVSSIVISIILTVILWIVSALRK
jgi:Flp pilus assembly protein protease CpaA